jgi:hypothetical protein
MNTKLGYFLATVAGAAVGSVATWAVLKPYYEKLTQKAINEVKETYSRPKVKSYTGENQPETESPSAEHTPEQIERKKQAANYEATLVKSGYTNYSDISSKKEAEPEPTSEVPYVISPAEFGNLDGYDIQTLKYYEADDTLTDDDDNVVDEELVGSASLSAFGDYEDDTVYVRNERLKRDYEILRENGRYTDVLREKPYLLDEDD